jgi:hypothetical protein
MLAGIEHFTALRSSRPAMATVAYAAAQRAWIWCDEGRARGYPCSDAGMARIREVSTTMLPLRTLVGAAPIVWSITAPPQCSEVVRALQSTPASGPPAGKVTLDDCAVVHTPSAWTAKECPATETLSCAHPRMVTPPNDCGDGRPCAQMRDVAMCPCFEATSKTQFRFSGSWSYGRWSGRFTVTRDGDETIAPVYGDRAPATPPQPAQDLLTATLQWALPWSGLRLQVAAAKDPDELAEQCAALQGVYGDDVLGMAAVAKPDCEHAYLREPLPAVVKPPIAPITPILAKDGYPARAHRFTAEQIAATKEAIERAAPGWHVTVGALGFLTAASFDVAGKNESVILEATRAFGAANAASLGFDAPPPVAESGSTYGGPRLILGTGTSFLEVRRNQGRGEIRSHLWPIACPAPDAQKILGPLVGMPATITTPGQICDRASGDDDCKSKPPVSRLGKLALRDMWLVPLVVPIVSSANPAEVELHCAAELHVPSLVVPQGNFPRYVDVVTRTELAWNGDESSILPLPNVN